MTPVQIEVALHYYYQGEQMKQVSQSVREAHTYLTVNEMLEYVDEVYQPTPKLRVYVDALKSIKLPIQTWVIPE